MGRRTCRSGLFCLVLLCCLMVSNAVKIKIPYALEDCASYTTCEECTTDLGCGFCKSPDNSNCVSGDQNGPSSGDCEGLWKFSTCSEDDKCSVQLNCRDCAAQENCGWCDTRCLPGNSSQPNDPEVPCEQWLYTTNSCTNVDCTRFTDCSVCAEQQDCAWCSQTYFMESTCFQGTEEYRNYDCDAQYWNASPDQCQDAIPCEKYTNCTTCIGDVSERCGWCKSSERCLSRDNPASCPDFQENSCDEDCTNYRDCEFCIEVSTCGWCTAPLGEPAFCTFGDASGPSFFNSTMCNRWNFETCPACDFDNCTYCNAHVDCSWCEIPTDEGNQGLCLIKTQIPLNATCDACYSPSVTGTMSISPTFATTTSATITRSPTLSATVSRVHLLSETSTTTASGTLSQSPSGALSPTPSGTLSPTPSVTNSTGPSNTTTTTITPSITITTSPTVTNTTTPSNTWSETSTISAARTPKPSRPKTPTSTRTESPSMSNSETTTSSTSPTTTTTLTSTSTRTALPSRTQTSSNTTTATLTSTPTPTLTSTPSTTKSESSSPTATSTSSETSTNSFSSSKTKTPKSATSTVSGSPTVTAKLTITPTRTPAPSASSTVPGQHTEISKTPTPSHTISNGTTNGTPENGDDDDTPWGIIVLVSVASFILLVVIIGIGIWLFYRFYWLKRWYFEKLK